MSTILNLFNWLCLRFYETHLPNSGELVVCPAGLKAKIKTGFAGKNRTGKAHSRLRAKVERKKVMAIFHCHVDCYRRSEGRSAVGGLAYRRGSKMSCNVTGKKFDFRKKEEVIYSEFIPANCDKRVHDLASIKKLFEQIETTEKHPRATLGREIECALPKELTPAQQVALSKSFISRLREEAKANNSFFDFSIHAKDGNHHAHIAMSERDLEEVNGIYGLSKTKRRDHHDKKFVEICRKIWEEETNSALKAVGIKQRVDRRTLAAQGVERIPTLHEGKSRHIKRGERKMINEKIKDTNVQILEQAEKEKAEAEKLKKRTAAALAREEENFRWHTLSDSIQNADEKHEELYQYRLAQEKYEGFKIFGLTYCNAKYHDHVTLYFSDHSKIVDHGSNVIATGGTAKANATRIIDLARLKGWKTITVTGSEDFVHEAVVQALFLGLAVKAADEDQAEIIKKIKAEQAINGVSEAITKISTTQNSNEIAFQKHTKTEWPLKSSDLSSKLHQKKEDPQKRKIGL